MNPTQVYNRILAGLITGLLAPHIEQATGVKLTPGDVEALIALAPFVWHAIAGVFAKLCAVFVAYFPPKVPIRPVSAPVPTQPAEPAKVD